MKETAVLGVDLGGTNLRVALIDRDGKILARCSSPTPGREVPEAAISLMIQLSQQALDQMKEPIEIAALGVGAPGPLSPREGRIIYCANLPLWRDVPLRALLENRMGVPVWVENDANAAAFGEFWKGAGRDGSDMTMLTLGTGLGSGVIVNGQLLYGHFENAAELGHQIVVLDGLPCPCGQRGCLEQYVSAAGMTRRAVEGIKAGASSGLSAEIDKGLYVDAARVCQLAREGDPFCSKIWSETCEFLAIACINIQHSYNSARVILGGGLALAGEFLLEPVKKAFVQRRWRLHDDFPAIQLAELGDDAGIVGAAGLAWRLLKRRGSKIPGTSELI